MFPIISIFVRVVFHLSASASATAPPSPILLPETTFKTTKANKCCAIRQKCNRARSAARTAEKYFPQRRVCFQRLGNRLRARVAKTSRCLGVTTTEAKCLDRCVYTQCLRNRARASSADIVVCRGRKKDHTQRRIQRKDTVAVREHSLHALLQSIVDKVVFTCRACASAVVPVSSQKWFPATKYSRRSRQSLPQPS